MKKILLVIISASILIAPINAMAAVKAGDACKKAGSTATVKGKKFTCIKSGKKLVWNKGVVVPGAKPTVIPTPTPTPIPSVEPTVTPVPTPTPTIAPFVPPYIPRTFKELENNLSGIIYGAWLDTVAQMKAGKPQLGNVQIFSAPGTEAGHPSALIPLGLTSQLFSKFPQPKNVYVIEMGYGDDKWAQDIFSRYADVTYGNVKTAMTEICPTPECGGGQAHRTRNWDGIVTIGIAPKKQSAEISTRIGTGMVYAHEYLHTIQFVVAKERWWYPPNWIQEGSAEWASMVIAYKDDYQEYAKFREFALREQYRNSGTFDAAWIEKFLNPYTVISETQEAGAGYYNKIYPRWYPYAFGIMAYEMLTVIKGPDAMLNMYTNIGKGSSFPEAFKAEFGISWAEAVPYLSRAIAAELKQGVKR
jgi:hypothetical protein